MLVDFLQSLSVRIASSHQNIIKMGFVMNLSNIPYYFETVFVSYVSTHLRFCIYLLISNRRKQTNIWRRKIKPIALIISSHKGFKLKYLWITFYCFFFIEFWPPVPKVILVLLLGWRQIVQHDMNSSSVSYFTFK